MQTLTAHQLREQLRGQGAVMTSYHLREQLRAPGVTRTDYGGRVLDEDAAVAAYLADPVRFHEATPDNPTGDPVTNLILNDGPWWIAAEDDE